MNTPGKLILIHSLLILFSFSLLVKNPVLAATPKTFKVLTFNIYHGEVRYKPKGSPFKSNLEIVANIINKVQPDIVALQEVDNKANRSQKIDLLTELALLTRMNPIFGRTMPFDGGEYGLGILSKYSFQSTQVHPLFSTSETEPRALLEACIVLETGDTIRFASTHLHFKGSGVQDKQAQNINDLIGKDGIPSIIAGDFNAVPGSETINILNEVWTDSSNESDFTSPSNKPSHKIDYIMYRPKNKWKVVESKVIEDKIASDHNPVLTVFELY